MMCHYWSAYYSRRHLLKFQAIVLQEEEIWRKYGRNGCNAGSIVIIMWCDGWAGAACNNSIHGRHHSSRRSTLDIIVQIFFQYSRYHLNILDIVELHNFQKSSSRRSCNNSIFPGRGEVESRGAQSNRQTAPTRPLLSDAIQLLLPVQQCYLCNNLCYFYQCNAATSTSATFRCNTATMLLLLLH